MRRYVFQAFISISLLITLLLPWGDFQSTIFDSYSWARCAGWQMLVLNSVLFLASFVILYVSIWLFAYTLGPFISLWSVPVIAALSIGKLIWPRKKILGKYYCIALATGFISSVYTILWPPVLDTGGYGYRPNGWGFWAALSLMGVACLIELKSLFLKVVKPREPSC